MGRDAIMSIAISNFYLLQTCNNRNPISRCGLTRARCRGPGGRFSEMFNLKRLEDILKLFGFAPARSQSAELAVTVIYCQLCSGGAC